jgi:Mannosyltransferase putative
MSRPCEHDHPPSPATCRLCWLFLDPGQMGESYRALWQLQEVTPPANREPARACRYLGRRVRDAEGTVKQRLQDTECCGPKLLDMFQCRHSVHGPETTLTNCARCPGFASRDTAPAREPAAGLPLLPPALTPGTPVVEVMGLLEGSPSALPAGWSGWENVRQAHVRLLERAIESCPPYPAERFHGRGIVSCVSAKPGVSSGKDLPQGYFPGAWVLVKELRRRGCTLPVTFAHLGPAEWDPHLTRLVEPLNVKVLDLHEVARRDPMRILNGWETKVFAVQHAPYEEVLFLDADIVPGRNPTYLFDDPHYRETGAVFWPDLPPFDRAEWLPEVVWRNIGLPPRNTVDFESGQFLINKQRCWRELLAARHINEHSDWYYRFVYGDKSTYHLAWSKCGTSWAMPSTRAGWMESSILQHDFDRRVLFFHVCQDKPSLSGYAHPGQLPQAGCGDHLAELRRLWSGRLWVDDHPGPADRALAARLRGQAFDYRRGGGNGRSLSLLDGGRIGLGATGREYGWSVLDEVLAVTGQDGQLTFLACEGEGGVWRGEWVEGPACEVVLTPLASGDGVRRAAGLILAGTSPAVR